jgi:MYXO-CTERM domain-containing protein
MRFSKALVLAVPLGALALASPTDASACGGCLAPPVVQQTEATIVTGHKMVLSISQAQTTLWDQITYSGQPESFAWVLPIRGKVDIGLSSDLLFQTLDQLTQVTVSSPVIQCDPPPSCGNNSGLASAGGEDFGSSGTGGQEPPVTVLAEEVVGPYETVQLKSSDPGALQAWLDAHGYEIPADVVPVINAYVSEGFDFLALKLVPGQGVQAMKPVRVTSPGATPVLPLRMVAAGTGVTTPITLWVAGEGRYETTNMPTFTIEAGQILWNWETSSSNYAGLKHAEFEKSGGKAWLVEDAEPLPLWSIQGPINSAAKYDPTRSGYGDPITGEGAAEEATADLAALLGGMGPSNGLWLTRLHGELSRAALGEDLQLGASSNQSIVERYLQTTLSVGTPPPCPTYPPCGGGGTFGPFGGGGRFKSSGTASCAMTDGAGAPAMLGGIALAAALIAARRRRR